jgi:amidase
MDELHYATITQLAGEIAAQRVSSVDVTEALLARIATADERLRAFSNVLASGARAQAAAADQEIAAGRYRGPLHGVPVAVKDLCDVAGAATVGGCAVLADNMATGDSTVVKRLAQAGAVLLGKLNLTEGAMAGYNPAMAVPENPWREAHWPGASSSGSGAATAAGLAFGTLGSDTGGSIRHPAAACGTVGLKPTWGLVSRYGVLDLAQSLDHIGPLTRSARDAGVMLQAIAGPDVNDPTTLPGPVPNVLAEIGASADGLRIGWDERFASDDLSPDFASRVADGMRVLEGLGASIVPVRVPTRLREYLAAWQVLCTSEAYAAHRDFYPARADEYGPWFREWLRLGSQYSAADYADAHHLRLQCAGAFHALLEPLDAFLCPTTAGEAYAMPLDLAYGPISSDRDPWQSRFTVPMDYAGVPTLALPCGLSDSGLPLSMQLVGKRCSEARLVRLGDAFEGVTTWHELHPPQWWL